LRDSSSFKRSPLKVDPDGTRRTSGPSRARSRIRPARKQVEAEGLRRPSAAREGASGYPAVQEHAGL